jgi:probable F420-dependent oxidoreductase
LDAVKVDAIMNCAVLHSVGAVAREAERLGFDGLLVPETSHDPFLALTLAAEQTDGVELGTRVAAALPRSPMHLAQVSHDLQTYCGGRLTLGLGAGNRTDLEQRFGVGWSQPVARMREMVLALRAIWRSWNEGEPLHFEGEFYRHTLMTSAFDPGPTGWGPPRIFLSAAEVEMAEVAGEVADGLFVTGPSSRRNLADVILPALERGLCRSGRKRSNVEVSIAVPSPCSAAELGGESFETYRDLADRIAVVI